MSRLSVVVVNRRQAIEVVVTLGRGEGRVGVVLGGDVGNQRAVRDIAVAHRVVAPRHISKAA